MSDPSDIAGREGEVSLSLFRPDQVTDQYLGWINDSDLMKYTEARFSRHTRQSVEEYVRKSNDDMGRARLWRIMLNEQHVGNLRLTDILPMHRRASVALIIGDRSVWGRGCATAAIRIASRYAFEVLSLQKLTAGMYSENAGSIRAFEKAGYHHEARLARHYVCDGRVLDGVLMARFADGARP